MFGFLTVHDCLTFSDDANLTVYSLVHKEFEYVGTSRLSITVSDIKTSFLTCYNAWQKRKYFTSKKQGF